MQLWQQQLMYKQLQEIQRQQQLQQLDHGARQTSPLSQLSAMPKPATGNQSPSTLNEIHANDAYNYMWPNNFVGGMPNLPSNSQMFTADNNNSLQSRCSASIHNLANGFALNDQGDAMRSRGFISQQINQTLHGIPVPVTSSVNQYSHFIGTSNNCLDLINRADATKVEKASYPSRTFQTDRRLAAQGCLQDNSLATSQKFQGKHFCENSPGQVLGHDVQMNSLQHNVQFQEHYGRQEQDDSSGNLQEKTMSQVGTSGSVASLDPIERELLFGTDDDNSGFSFGGCLISGMGADMHGHSPENDNYGVFPSIHSGSWSALMQEAVQASGSDKGLQEEWAGLSVQKSEQLMAKPHTTTSDNGKRPPAWDDRNLEIASLTSTPFPLFSDANATPTYSTGLSDRHPFKSAHEENNKVLTDTPNASLLSSSRGANNTEFHQNQSQSHIAEDCLQAQKPSTNGVWAGQAIEQNDKRFEDVRFISQEIGCGWGNQQNLPLSNISIQSVSRLNGWNTKYPVAFRDDITSNYHETDGNLCKTSDNHPNPNSELQPVKSFIRSPKMQAENSLAGNFRSGREPNNLKLNQDVHQQVINTQQTDLERHFALNTCVSAEGVQDVEKTQNQPSKRPQTWESSVKRLGENHENVRDNGRVVVGEGYVGNTAKEKSLLTANDQYPFVIGGQKSSIQSGQHIVGSKMLQNSLGSVRTVDPSLPSDNPLSLKGLSNSVFHGSSSEEQKFVGKTQFAGNIVINRPAIVSKRTAVGSEELQSRNTMPVCASHSSFGESTAQCSQTETNSQASNNMLELFQKVDQSRNGNSINASDLPAQAAADLSVTHPHLDRCSNLRGFGLQLSPPSQSQPLPNYAPISKTDININSRQLDKEAGYEDQPCSNSLSSVQPVPPLDESCRRENRDKMSSLSGQRQKEHPEANKHFIFSSPAASESTLAVNQLQEHHQQLQQHVYSAKDHLVRQQQQGQQQNISDTIAHEELDQSVNFSFGNQTNTSAFVKNVSLVTQPCDSHDGVVPGQSIQTSLPPAGRFPTSGVASFAETHVPVGSQISSGGTDHTKLLFAGCSQFSSSGQQLPVMQTKSASQSSISGMSQQVAFSKMLHNVWANISAQQHQAGISPQNLTPKILQSIINNARDTSFQGMPKPGDQVHKEGSATPEVGTSSANSRDEGNPVQVKSLNLIYTEKPGDAYKSTSAFHGEKAVLRPPLDGGPSVPISSLVHLHQQDINKAINGQAPALSSSVLRPPLTSNISSSCDIGISGCTSQPSDVQKNYSLLYQVQSMKASDSDVNMMTGKVSKSVGSNASQMKPDVDKRFDLWQSTVSRTPTDGKAGATSQISILPDPKMLSFASNDSEERIPSPSTTRWHDVQTHACPVGASSTVNIMGVSERTQISPQMAPSWFDHPETCQKGWMMAVYDAQRSEKAAIQQNFFQKIPARMDNSHVVEQKFDSNQFDSYGQGTSATKMALSESSPSVLPSDVIMDHDINIRSKKRKTTTDLSWHKIVTEPQRLPSISMAELDWAHTSNRLIEKVDDESEIMEDGPLAPQSRRRLILTTQLMHQLIPAAPAVMFKGDATSAYESVIFSVAKSALSDACGLISSLESNLHVLLGNENMISGELKTSKKVEDDTFSKLMEDFVGRSKKLESEFSRLEKRASILDVRLECQELENFSIVNQLGKFHGRTRADGIEVSSTSQTAHRKLFPQRYTTVLPATGNFPEGVLCLSL
ncbi:hypothetical protein MUK42_20093 [Musa troglodytarum]|uniref:Uncharacterized protein n=1 Tax=Musa troglodytarum TaxID=320322 RepID=A0A9E7EAA1_9LILI|nr:hypothetical protein MUK42_20093 [Musa troglodytarum]URD73222.1 hypothetical protein MUK42_20093 [Musa troglodytarum]URD73223.1 hypothetical protein MUK42_20093 [Musa troglodytarum]